MRVLWFGVDGPHLPNKSPKVTPSEVVGGWGGRPRRGDVGSALYSHSDRYTTHTVLAVNARVISGGASDRSMCVGEPIGIIARIG